MTRRFGARRPVAAGTTRRSGLWLAAGAALAILLAYLLLWPVPVDPASWRPDPDPGHTGPYAANDRLADVQLFPLPGYHGPEHVAVDSVGRMYTGTESGWILRIDPVNGEVEEWVDAGGRPLGLEFDGAGHLIVADAVRGLLSVAPDGSVLTLVREINGVPLRFANELAIGPDGRIYFSESSARFGAETYGSTYAASFRDLLEHRGTGRLLVYDPVADSVWTLLEGLAFANGIAVSPDGSFLLVAETASYRIWRVELTGPDAPSASVRVSGLPGFPDNLTTGTEGRFWVALASPRDPLVDALADDPFLRKVVLRIPRFLRPGPKPHSHVIAIDSMGRVLVDLQDPAATYPNITGVTEAGGHLYLGSVWGSTVARLESPEEFTADGFPEDDS